jgi:hypothetical protein
MDTATDRDPLPRLLAAAVAGWALLALLVAASGALRGAPRPLIPLSILALVAGGVLAHRRSSALRELVARMDPRPVILFHLLRIAFGAAFLHLAARGELPAAFAHLAGPGDIVAGVLALPAAAAAANLASPGHRAVVLGWNLLGLADILAVVVTAQRLLILEGDPLMAAAIVRFPVAALPLFVVPAVILDHLAVFARLR